MFEGKWWFRDEVLKNPAVADRMVARFADGQGVEFVRRSRDAV
jgi:hypothetical protein